MADAQRHWKHTKLLDHAGYIHEHGSIERISTSSVAVVLRTAAQNREPHFIMSCNIYDP